MKEERIVNGEGLPDERKQQYAGQKDGGRGGAQIGMAQVNQVHGRGLARKTN
jgi:hypothetical protein